MSRPSLVWMSSISIGVILLYLLGVLVRGQFGIAVCVHNVSGQSLQGIRIKVEPSGKDYDLGRLVDQERARVFVEPRTESHVALQYTDASGPHGETVVGYLEYGYCGKADINILPEGKVTSSENIDPLLCKKSWLDFM